MLEATVTLSIGMGACPPAEAPGDQGLEPRRADGSGPMRSRAHDESERASRVLSDLLKSHYAVVWRTLRRLGVLENRIDDAAQEVFIIASRKLDRIEAGCERKYLLSSALRVAANYRRTGYVRREVFDEPLLADRSDPTPHADELVDRKRLRHVLDSVLDHWPAEVRTVFVLFGLEGLSVPEIAELTATKPGTVASRLRRSRELFQAAAKRLKARGLIEGGSS
jgi:RNA polymerase sigma-70 factor (ECF subfamily)